eukprot:8786666-Ditylum_brightwellii.AAC.1
MVQKEGFKADIQAAIAGHVPPDHSIVTQSYKNNGHKIEGKGAKVPPVCLGVSSEKFGNGKDRLWQKHGQKQKDLEECRFQQGQN